LNLTTSELIRHADGSIYHLHLRPEQLAPTVLLVGDPDRVPMVSRYFDRLEHQVRKREFVTHTGWLGRQRLTVLSTGIGTDNIDIVLNELDALVNIDLAERTVRRAQTSLRLIRLGTAGSLSADIPVDTLVLSAFGIGMDNLLTYYPYQPEEEARTLQSALADLFTRLGFPFTPAVTSADTETLRLLSAGTTLGMTLTSPGFYGPQGRSLRLPTRLPADFFEAAGRFRYEGLPLANFEMETAGIYGLAHMLGHRAVSCSTILANRVRGEFTADASAAVDRMIRLVLERLSELP
jgi:uridine phosphorylase